MTCQEQERKILTTLMLRQHEGGLHRQAGPNRFGASTSGTKLGTGLRWYDRKIQIVANIEQALASVFSHLSPESLTSIGVSH